MSGIAGVFNRNGEPVRRETIISMCDAISHRGPHGRGIWTDGPVGFGHVLLHTTEESTREEQPFTLDGRTWVTADARIDNRDGLIDLLKSHVHSGVDLKEATDVELLLHAYRVWGVDCVNYIIGVFGVAIWDGSAQHLVCLRDHLGIKPFYYAEMPDHLIFASEAKGILASGLVPKRIFEPRIADYLVNHLEGIDKSCTFFEHILRLPPAHRMIAALRKISLGQYWTLDFEKRIRFLDQRDYEEAFKEKIYGSVKAQLRGITTGASMLSGGLDSSTITAVARNIIADEGTEQLKTFSVVDDSKSDCAETWYINRIISANDIDSCTIDVEDVTRLLKEISKLEHTTDDLFDMYMHVPQVIYIVAGGHGQRVVLDGVDGDLVMGQPGNHVAWLVQQNKWSEALKEAQQVRNFYYRFPKSSFSYFFRACLRAFVPNYLLSFRNWWRGLNTEFNFKREVGGTIINYDFAKKVNLLERTEKLQSHTAKPGKINMHQLHVKALQHPYLTVGLERYDRVASLYGIEPRHPLLDQRLVEYCVAIPWTQKISNGWTKYIARRAMIEHLPEEVIWRRGWEHLGPRVFMNLVSSLYQSPTESFEENIDMISQYVDIDEVRRVLQISNSPEAVSEWADWRKIYDAIVLGAFLKNWS